jgi:hypothetical protein
LVLAEETPTAVVFPDVLRSNAFRTLRCPVECTAAEAHKAAGSLRRAASLGTLAPKKEDLPELGDLPRDEQALRMAIGRLESASQRLRDRMFWFHHPRRDEASAATGEEGAPARFDDVARAHDAALYRIVALYSTPLDAEASSTWTDALRQWHALVTNTEYRRLALATEERCQFEPAALPSEIDSALADAVRLAGEPLVTAGREAMLRKDNATIFAIVLALTELEDTGRWAAAAQEELLVGPIKTLRDACQHNGRTYGDRIVRKPDQVLPNVAPCEEALAHFRSEIGPALALVQRLAPAGHSAERQAREMTAMALYSIAGDHTWAEKYDVALKLTEEALALVSGTPAALRIQEALAGLRVNAQKQLFAVPWRALQGACELNRRKYGERIFRKPDHVRRNVETCADALAHFRSEIQPALAELQSRAPAASPVEQRAREMTAMTLHSIASDHTWAEKFVVAVELDEEALALGEATEAVPRIEESLGKLRALAHRERVFGGLLPITSAPSLRTVNGMGFGVYGRSDYDRETNSYVTTHCFCFVFLPIFPVGRYRVIAQDKGYRFMGQLPLTTWNRVHLAVGIAAIVGAFILILEAGSQRQSRRAYTTDQSTAPEGYSRRSYVTQQSEELAHRIKQGRHEIEELERRLAPVMAQLKDLHSRIEDLEAVLGRPDDPATQKASVTSKVALQRKLHNDLVGEYAALRKSNAKDLDEYEARTAEDSRMTDEYNRLQAQ